MSFKWKILAPVIFLALLVATKFILWNFPVSNGKRVGNLTKISKKGKFWFTKTWEGTIDEGSGDKLTTYFSVRDDALANELYNYEGRKVVLYYEQYLVGWPWDTNYNVTSWKAAEVEVSQMANIISETDSASKELSKALFCSLLGTIYNDQELYQRVKDFVKENNLYLYRQYDKCNE